MRRLVGIVTVLIGLGFIAMPIAFSLFDRTRAAGQLTDSVRPTMSDESFAKLQDVFGGS